MAASVAGEVHVVVRPEEWRGVQASAPVRLAHAVRRAVAVRHAHDTARTLRLLVICGLAVVGWLLGGAATANAEAAEPPAAPSAISSVAADAARQVVDVTRELGCAPGGTARCAEIETGAETVTPRRGPTANLNTGRSAATPEDQTERRKAGPQDPGPVPPKKATDRPGAMGAPEPSGADEAAFGRSVENVTSAPKPALPRHLGPIQSPDVSGFVPQTSGNSGQAGMGFGDIARAWNGARLMVVQVPEALHLPPAVRNGADEPSFSPD